MAIFNSKFFNPEVFGKYLETVPRVKQNALIKAGVLRARPELKSMLVDQTGGNYISMPMTGLIGGSVLNYDGNTDITASSLDTYLQSMIVCGRAKAWEEKDFTKDITGKDFMEEIAKQVANYWDDVEQSDLLSILKGIFGVSIDGFSEKHTLDISGAATNVVGAGTLNDAIQKASGDNKNLFTLVVMHSQVSTNLENLQLLNYFKGTDANGVQRDLALATWNGRTVLIDDDVPVNKVETTAGVHSVTISTKATAGDSITINGVKLVAGTDFSLSTDTAAGNASAIAGALGNSTDPAVSCYTWTASSAKVVGTEKTGYYGVGPFAASATKGTSGTLVISAVATDTPSVVSNNYTTYIMAQGAFDYCDCGAAIPSEVYRQPLDKGGKDILITRQRKLYAPKGFSFVNASIMSPTGLQLEDATNWGIVKNSGNNAYFNSKAIPFARIISKG